LLNLHEPDSACIQDDALDNTRTLLLSIVRYHLCFLPVPGQSDLLQLLVDCALPVCFARY